MNVILDTQAWLWFALGDQRLSKLARETIEDRNVSKYISPASYWELAIKISMGKYELEVAYSTFMQSAIEGYGFRKLPIEPEHTKNLTQLTFHHKDPFDRLIISQALSESMGIVSSDFVFDAYEVKRIW